MNQKLKTLSISISALVLIIGFQNCRNGIQMSELPADSSALALAADDGSGDGAGQNDSSGSSDPSAGSEDDLNPSVPTNPYEQDNSQLALLPISGDWASVAYEDNILNIDGGDRDYNDAVFNYKISEQYNTANQLVRIFLEVRLREKISGNNHYLHLIVNGQASSHFTNIKMASLPVFNGQANAKITYADGSVANVSEISSKKLTLFKATTGVKGNVTKVQIDIADPELNINSASPKIVDFKKYRFVLQNHGQDKIGIDIAEINPSDEMLANGNSYPFGFMIPTDWQPPAERQLIDDKYPSFYKYREWLKSESTGVPPDDVLNWFLP